MINYTDVFSWYGTNRKNNNLVYQRNVYIDLKIISGIYKDNDINDQTVQAKIIIL